ncbi:hypothetical protein H4V97_003098 [Flavobacterium sp. CG_23.5]|uniref:hypothetical protein n=1 Tax=Flavobacterium sp. CG_23.5 TaxID=2760708 RepID=UPI001AE4EF1D|nr:hypothetical protein [Flavobacterium sp. CG_23.5]MBP2284780.1 hypothetical protein [Flavobacterium sp. CG_23.5]
MLKLVKLNQKISELLNFDIDFNESINNFSYNKMWVNEIPSNYFKPTISKIEKLIDKNIDYNDEQNIYFIESVLEDIQELIKSLNNRLLNYSSYDFSKIEWSVSFDFPDNPPENLTTELPTPLPSNNSESKTPVILQIVREFFKIEDTLDDSLIDVLIEKNIVTGYDDYELELIFAKAHLVYALILHLEMIYEVAGFFDSIIQTYKRRKAQVEEKLISFIPEDLKLEFNLSKTNLGHLFYNLYEIGIIAKDKKDVKDERTNLKNYINHANIYYFDKSTFTKVQKMTRAMPVDRNLDSKLLENEITFLNDMVEKLSQRIDSLTKIKAELVKRGH